MSTDAEPAQPAVDGAPSVGNVLGFSLLLRDRKALLSLDARVLGAGIRLADYEAEIPGVRFPLAMPLTAMRYRHRRCLARGLTLSFERRTLLAELRARLVGAPLSELGEIVIDAVDLRLAMRLAPSEPALPCLLVHTRHCGARGLVLVALRVRPVGRRLAFTPMRIWAIGTGLADGERIWRRIAKRIWPIGLHNGELVIDAARDTLLHAFVRAGWKAPDLGDLVVASLQLLPERVIVRLRPSDTDEPAAAIPSVALPSFDPIADRIAAIHRALDDREVDAACVQQQSLADALVHLDVARLAVLRWLAHTAGPEQPRRSAEALRTWVHLAPRDDAAQRALLTRLWHVGAKPEIAQRLAAACRLPNSPRRQARLELALACAFVDHRDDREGARALLLPLLRRLADDPALADVRTDALACLARATVDDPPAALQVLHTALELDPRPAIAADLRATVGRALARAGHVAEALPLLREAVRGAPDDVETHQTAIDIAERVGDVAAIRELLDVAIARAEPSMRSQLYRRAISWLFAQADHGAQALLTELVMAALRHEPDAPDLLSILAELEHRRGDPTGAADVLGKLADRADDPQERLRLRLRRTRLLAEAGAEAQAWAAIEPALADAEGELEMAVLVAALEVAPPGSREDIIDRLIAIDAGDAGGRAMLERADRSPSPNQRRRDLQRAAELLDDPRPALRQLADLAPTDRTEPWAALAKACAELRDVEGEHAARIELSLRLIEGDAAAAARDELARAHRLRPQPAIAILLGLTSARAGDLAQAAEILQPFARGELFDPRGSVLADPRTGVDARPARLAMRIADILQESGDLAAARGALRLAQERLRDPELRRRVAERIAALSASLHDPSVVDDHLAVASLYEDVDAVPWLLRAAEHAAPALAATILRTARDLAPLSGEILAALEDHARRHDDTVMLEDVLRQRATVGDATRRLAARRELLARRRRDDGEDAIATIAAAREVLALDASDATAARLVAADLDRRGDDEAAARLWRIAYDSLAPDDPRLPGLAARLAQAARRSGDLDAARRVLAHALEGSPTLDVFDELFALAEATDDDAMRLHAAEGRRALASDDEARARADLELSRLFGRLGDVRSALDRLSAAAGWATPGSELHVEIASARLALCEREALGPEAEAAARAELRRARRGDVSQDDRRTEAQTLVELGRPLDALAVLLEGLDRSPTDALLLSELKPLAALAGRPQAYVDALERALDDVLPTDQRDRLALELAMAAAALGLAPEVLRAAEHASPAIAASDEMLDAWDWALITLGRQEQELARIDEQLLRGAADPSIVRRLQRRIGEPAAFVEHLLQLAAQREGPAHDLLRPALARATKLGDLALLLRAVRTAIGRGATDLLAEIWDDLEDRVVRSGDEIAIADLVQLADEGADPSLRQRGRELLDAALAWIPQAPPLHRALWARLEGSDDDETRMSAAMAHVQRITEEAELSHAEREALVVGVTRQLPRRRAGELLNQRAEQALHDPEAFKVLLDALEQDGHWPEAMRLHELRAAQASSVAETVAIYKHLAHLSSDTLGDPIAAAHHLETALELSPHDPDLLLPLLDHNFAREDLARAMQLSFVVLDHVTMGPTAYAALGHRAADAAVARGEPDTAAQLLQKVVARVPSDARAIERLTELQRIADDPARRVGVLAAVADRQSGEARVQALEERARLLVDPLDRIDDAIADLETVVAEAPARTESAELLADLYRRTARFDALATLLERSLPRHHGEARARVLAELATINREALGDHARSEQAARTALEQIDADSPLWDELSRHIAVDLARQQRWADLAAHLEQWLAADLEPEAPTPSPVRIAELRVLAETYRDKLEDQAGAARVYERLLELDAIPEDGLAELARWYHRERRHRDLVRVLQLRAHALQGEAYAERRAAVELRIAELLEDPIGRPHEAAPHYLEAYLADPETYAPAGARARVLLSGTDSIVNVRRRLRERLGDLPASRRPALLTLLADLLAPQEGYEDEAEAYYRKALELDDGAGAASEGLGRLLVRRGRLEEGAQALLAAARSDVVAPTRAADCAAAAARQLIELGELERAERALKVGLRRRPDSQRVLLELARLYERTGRRDEQTRVLEQLAAEPLSIALQAEVAYRRALLLQTEVEADPRGPASERARALLLEAVGADPTHVGARQTLLELATAAGDWTIVAHMQFLAVRELPPGSQRARAHLDLAQTYLDRVRDADAALRNLESAVQQAGDDIVVIGRASELGRRMPVPPLVAERFEALAGNEDLPENMRARLWLAAADLRMVQDDEPVTLEPVDHSSAAESERREAADVIARLDEGPPPAMRLHLLGRLHELSVALNDPSLRARADDEAQGLAATLQGESASTSAGSILRDLVAGGEAYDAVVSLYERLAERVAETDAARAAGLLVEGARVAWTGLGRFPAAAALLARACTLHDDASIIDTAVEVAAAATDTEDAAAVYTALGDRASRSPALALALCRLAVALELDEDALRLAAPLTEANTDLKLRFDALGLADSVLARRGETEARIDGLSRRLDVAIAREDPLVGNIAVELARLLRRLGQPAAARSTCAMAIEHAPAHRGLIRAYAQLLEDDQSFVELVRIYERLADTSADDEERADWLTRAAQVLIAHPDVAAGEDPTEAARRRLRRAAALAPTSMSPRLSLLPLSFVQGRFAEVLELATELRGSGEAPHEVLALAALAEAYEIGRGDLAAALGPADDPSAVARTFLPGLEHVLERVATKGPLPRLDPILAVAASLCGGRGPLLNALHDHVAARRVRAGTALALARLHESRGAADPARYHYQLAAFLAPHGPVPALVGRLPPGPLHVTIEDATAAPLEAHRPLRTALVQLGPALAGIEPRPGPERSSPPADLRVVIERAEAIVARWRPSLHGVLPVAWVDGPDPFGIGVRNAAHPSIVITPSAIGLPDFELQYRLADAAATIVMGLAVLESGTFTLADLLEAIRHATNPMLRPTLPGGRHLADVLAQRQANLLVLPLQDRADIVQDVDHLLGTPTAIGRLQAELTRARRLFATKLCGRLDGALAAIMRDEPADASPPASRSRRARALLRRPDVQWLLAGVMSTR